MKKHIGFLATLFWASFLTAQTPPSVRLAIVPETPESGAVADLLTAAFSGNPQVQLLERAEIERVYREQGLAAANRNYLKLGQVLGADGLLLLETVEQGTNRVASSVPRVLNVRLVAVKPGVLLAARTFPWPLKDVAEWSTSFSKRLVSFLPKLAVLAKDAVPVSVVNLRSAVSSPEALETERELKFLAIQRLSWEPRLFVLDRERMQLLAAEKALQADESAFWSGSYLFEGVVDQNGYAKEVVTVNARLTPPHGGQPLLFEVSGSRTNLAEVVNRLAIKVSDLLKANSGIREWNAADEAGQYFSEAQWALRWGIAAEAQSAAESAWALGKKDLPCALVRIRAYLQGLPAVIAPYQTGTSGIGRGHDVNGNPVGPTPTEAQFRQIIRIALAGHKFVRIVKTNGGSGGRGFEYVYSDALPNVKSIAPAARALELYEEFSRSSPEGEPKILSRGKGWNDQHNSEWYQLGIDALVAASKVLQNFNLAPDAQEPVKDKLAELRVLARAVAARIQAAPSVHDSYYLRDPVPTSDELRRMLGENDSIFRCETQWGCYWHEKPEEILVLYRQLMTSPAFGYIHSDLWAPKPPASRLAAWNQEDQQRIPALWNSFVAELQASTNEVFQAEARALVKADSTSEDQAKGLETASADQECWQKAIAAKQSDSVFEKQKRYLASFTPYDWKGFCTTFESRGYTRAQAIQLQPLIASYKSNLLAQLPASTSQAERFKTDNNVRWIEFYLEKRVSAVARGLMSPGPNTLPPQQPPPPVSQPLLPGGSALSTPASIQTPELVTNALLVKSFLPIPLNGLPGDRMSALTITAHHWLEGKLLLDLQYGGLLYSFDGAGRWKGTRTATCLAIAILDLTTQRWQVISCPEAEFATQNRFYHRTTLCQGDLYTSDGGRIRKYNAAKKSWQVLEIPEVGNCELFAVNGCLYAATPTLIVEILDGGSRTRILASNRRQPAQSALDTENLGTPALFAGPGQSLRAATADKIVSWNGNNWSTLCPAPRAPLPPVISDSGILFLANGWNAPAGIWRLATESSRVELCIAASGPHPAGPASSGPDQNAKPLWTLPPAFPLPALSAASHGQDLYLLADHAKSKDIVDEQQHLLIGKKIQPQNGYHAELLRFARNRPTPDRVFLKFDAEDASLPVTGESSPPGFRLPDRSSPWLLCSSNYLFCGRETAVPIPAGGADPKVTRPPTGVWLIPLEQIDHELVDGTKGPQE